MTSRKSSSRLPARSGAWLDSPVTLPPGRARLATRPPPTGSFANAKTIGMTGVTRFKAATTLPTVTMTSAFSRTNSAAISAASVLPAIFDYDGSTFDPSEFTQPRHKGSCPGTPGRSVRTQEPYGWQSARLLPAYRHWPRDRARESCHELAPSHHSMTSSARASSAGGTSRPSAFAVIRLSARSNLVGCSTGISPGFAPRRILST